MFCIYQKSSKSNLKLNDLEISLPGILMLQINPNRMFGLFFVLKKDTINITNNTKK